MQDKTDLQLVCGIVGIFRFDNKTVDENALKASVDCLNKRGPDANGIYIDHNIGLGHTRLSIIDPDPKSNQPFQDETGRYTLVFNGEIFNYQDLKSDLQKSGIQFHTKSDTEVFLHLLIKEGTDCLKKLNGFFAFGFYDSQTKKLLLGRDKYGVKPLYIYKSKDYIAFASELKSLIRLGIPKSLNYNSLVIYFQLNYIPSPDSILLDVHKLKQAHCNSFYNTGNEETIQYYHLKIEETEGSYSSKKQKLENLLDEAVKTRLVSDVPVGVFLSGGVDSSIVSMLAKRHKPDIQSFSVGFKGNSSFDESIYAENVARHLGLNHHTFHLSDQMMLDSVEKILDYIDEPFADSSAIAVYNLCFQTKKHATVALTGDGADEVFGGYNKHLAEIGIRKPGFLNSSLSFTSPMLHFLPESRGANVGNAFRKLKKYSQSVALSQEERYWEWCCFTSSQDVNKIFSDETKARINYQELTYTIKNKTKSIKGNNINYLLATDIDMVLEGDMLVKTDRMSMANSMELRNPFLDSRVVDFAFTLSEKDKIDRSIAKIILKDTFRPYLPSEVFDRPKRGFEVPLIKWLKEDLYYLISKYLNRDLIIEHKIFDPDQVEKLIQKLNSSNPGESGMVIWALINFQLWFIKNFEEN